ncbi:MAG: M20 family metallopeptidase [Alphaproteobacteria bacterium]
MQNQFLKELKELVTIDCGTKNIAGVHKIADIITGHFNAMGGWKSHREDISAECGPILYFTNKPDAKKYDITLLCHMDTVYADGTCAQHPPFIDGDKYRGPGVSDMKSGCLAVIYALKNMDKTALDKLSICACFTPDEEIGALYSYNHIEKLAEKSEYVFVGEASRPNGDMIKARKGNGKIQIEFFGKAAHAGSSLQDGISAITELAHWVLAINNLVDLDKGTTASVGVIEGGSGINVVPDYAKALVDQRFLVNSEGKRTLDYLTNLSKTPFVAGAKVEVKRLAGRPAFEVSNETDNLINIIQTEAKKLNFDVDFITGGGASDGNITASKGIPTIDGFGPCGGGFHNVKEEFIYISTIEPRIKLLQHTLEAMAHYINN